MEFVKRHDTTDTTDFLPGGRANLLRTYYGETGVMDFGLLRNTYSRLSPPSTTSRVHVTVGRRICLDRLRANQSRNACGSCAIVHPGSIRTVLSYMLTYIRRRCSDGTPTFVNRRYSYNAPMLHKKLHVWKTDVFTTHKPSNDAAVISSHTV